jgi:4-hydroxymandelate oxidase
VDVSAVDLRTTVLGQPMPFPVILAPTAFHRAAHPDGEVATARGASSVGATMCVSTSATMPLADIMATGVPAWFQLYVHQDRGVSAEIVRMAVDTGCTALVLTIDVPHLGNRERDVRNDMDAWFPKDIRMENLYRAGSGMYPGAELFDPDTLFFDASLSWRDLEWLRGLSDLPLVIKGVMTAEDAVLSVEHGASALVVSNHGGRQLDGVAGSLDVVPEVVDAVGGKAEVLMDGGVRRGTDVVKALALGARAVMIGRPYLWGLVIDGERGVRWVLEKLRAEVELAMGLTGAPSVDAVSRSMIAPAPR